MKTKPLSYVSGTGITHFGELYDYSLEDLILEAAVKAIENSRLSDFRKLDLVVISSMTASDLGGQGHLSSLVTQLLGISVPVISVDAACAGGGSAIGVALTYLRNNGINKALVLGVEKLTDQSSERVSRSMMNAASYDEETMLGLTFPALNALVAQRYIHEYGLPKDTLSKIAIKNHSNGFYNKIAHIKRKITKKNYFDSEMVAEPLRLYDCAPISDGCAAVVLSNSKVKNSTAIIGFTQTHDSLSLHKRKKLTTLKAVSKGIKNLVGLTGVDIRDIDVLELHDAFTILELISLEDLGYFKKGQGYKAYERGFSSVNGKLSINPSGGLKSCGHPVSASGIRQAIEVHNQILGLCEKERQVKNVRFGLTQNLGGVAGTCTLSLIGKHE